MLNGIPVLASNRGALPETISDAGFLFDIPAKYTPGSREIPSAEEVEPWVQTIIRLWDDAAQYEGCSRAAQERAKRWRPDRLAPIYREFFAGITRQRGAPLAPRGLAARDELQEAEQICRRVLQSEPNNTGAAPAGRDSPPARRPGGGDRTDWPGHRSGSAECPLSERLRLAARFAAPLRGGPGRFPRRAENRPAVCAGPGQPGRC